jgi:general stress protein CsbA
MAAYGEKPSLLINKFSGLVLIILGFLFTAEGYREGATWLITAGIVFLVVGLVFLVLKIIQRNEGSSPR